MLDKIWYCRASLEDLNEKPCITVLHPQAITPTLCHLIEGEKAEWVCNKGSNNDQNKKLRQLHLLPKT